MVVRIGSAVLLISSPPPPSPRARVPPPDSYSTASLLGVANILLLSHGLFTHKDAASSFSKVGGSLGCCAPPLRGPSGSFGVPWAAVPLSWEVPWALPTFLRLPAPLRDSGYQSSLPTFVTDWLQNAPTWGPKWSKMITLDHHEALNAPK